MAEISPDLQRYIEELDRRDIRLKGAGGYEMDQAIFERLLSLGVVIPSTDAFSFDGKGVLLVGKADAVKSLIVDKFRQLYTSRVLVLARKNPTVYQSQAGTKPVVFLDDVHSQDIPFFAPFLFRDSPEQFQEFQLEYILSLKQSSGEIRNGNIASAINGMVFWSKAQQKSRLRAMFTEVKCYDVPAAQYQLGVYNQNRVLKRFDAAANQNLEKIVASMVKLMTTGST